VDVSECRGEVAMTTEPEIDGQIGQIVVISQRLEGPGQAQPKLVPISGRPSTRLKTCVRYTGENPTNIATSVND
jgi:hypothetical protein